MLGKLFSRLTNERLEKAFDFCLTEEARTTAGECYRRAVRTVEAAKHEFISFVREPVSSSTGNGSHSIFEIVDIFYPEQPLESLWGCSIEQPLPQKKPKIQPSLSVITQSGERLCWLSH
jgi:hypothetical protein